MELKDTIIAMQSCDYQDRFRAEYFQLKIRTQKLHVMIEIYKNGTLTFTPNCSLWLLSKQEEHMEEYLHILEERARIENIEL